MSSGQVGRGLFALGGTGAIILTVASVIMAVIGLWPLWIPGYSFIWYLILITGLVLLLIGSIFVGIAYYAFYRHFEHPIGIAGLVFGVICPVALLVFAVIGMYPMSYGYYYPSYYLSPFSLVLYWLGLLLFGTMLVIWGVASIVIRKSTSMPGLSLATGIVLIVAGCFAASFLLTFVGFILLLASQIMNAIVFLKMAVFQN
jgi:hypothetical protein